MEVLYHKKTERIYIICTDCGGKMTCVNKCLPAYEWLVFRCDKCGKVLNHQKEPPEIIELTQEQIDAVNAWVRANAPLIRERMERRLARNRARRERRRRG